MECGNAFQKRKMSKKRRQQTQTKEETVKKLWLTVALVALGGLAINTYADVQNIRVSGDIRMRGYWLDNVAFDNETSDSFISQRTRVTVEADLEDHVLVVVTLKAEGLWGSDDEAVHGSSGAGGRINRGFDVGINEAYVQLNELFYTPATLKLGRQYLHYGHGLILSSVDQEYNYDAARLVVDYYPLTVDLVYSKASETSAFGPGSPGAHDLDLLFLNARYEKSDSIIKNVEAYFGWLANGGTFPLTRIPPSDPLFTVFQGASPWIVGVRSDMAPVENLQVWVEGAYEGGADGDQETVTGVSKSISAFLLNAGGRYTLKNVQWSPVVNANYIYASGGGGGNSTYFRPWFDYVDGYNGYVFHPALTDIHIFNLGASVKPYENTTLSVQGYYYMKADQDGIAFSNPNVDFGFTGAVAAGTSRDIGWEVDTILGYDYSKDVRAQLVYAAFIPGKDVHTFTGFDSTAHELRGEINVKF